MRLNTTNRALGLLCAAVMGWPAEAQGADLTARESLPELLYTTGESTRSYTRLASRDRSSYLFCGQGELVVSSRAAMPSGVAAARYTLDLTIDGATPVRELGYRVTRVATGSFDGEIGVGALRRATIDLGRGCHTVELTLAKATVEAVGVRLTWREEPATRRRWSDIEPAAGARHAVVTVDEKRTPYAVAETGRSVELTVDGPAWVRLLARPIEPLAGPTYPLVVQRKGRGDRAKGRAYRAYRLTHEPSRKARVAGQDELRLGRANQIVFAVGPGRHRLGVASDAAYGVLVRPQVAERSAARLPGATEPGWGVRGRLASYYDSNILRYSDKFIQRFEDGRDPDRFRVESLDDTVQRADLYVDRRFTGPAGQPASLGLAIEHRGYLRNSIKDWTRFTASWEQALRRGRRIQLTLNHAPNFYVRHIRDSDLTGAARRADPFQAFEFERSEGRLGFAQPLGASFTARYHLGLASFRHSVAFREFDSENAFGGLRLDQQLTRRLRLSYGVELTESSARGYDEAGETRATSDDTDPSYRQLDLMMAARYRLPGERRQTLFLQAEAGQRDYTTDKSTAAAPLHAGRDDDLLRFYASWQIDLSSRYGLTVFAQSRSRSSSAPIDLDIGVEKDFDQWEAGLRLTARFGS
ncbi:MAG: hypothetical protein AAF657_18615 [Acidobacteriota bacterium]